MPVGLLDSESPSLEELRPELSGDPICLFEEARQRRRKRMVFGSVIVCLVLAFGGTFLILGGAGNLFGGPPTHSGSRGPSGGLTDTPSAAKGTRSGPSGSGRL